MVQVSTLIPVYNGEEYIADAVDSVLAQRDVKVEIIVIDDGSTDRTPEILRQYGDKIRVLRQKNGGHVNARNNGSKLAKGEWLAFLDADDAWLPDKLAKQLELANGNVGMVYTDRENFGDIARVTSTASQTYSLWEGDIFEPLLFGNFVTVASVIIKMDWFERLGGFDEELLVCEDWDMWLRFSASGGTTKVCREPLTRYRWHAASMTNNQERMCHGRLKVLKRALESERGKRLPRKIVNQALASVWKCSAWYARPWHRWIALKWYMRSAQFWPWDGAVYKDILKCVLGTR